MDYGTSHEKNLMQIIELFKQPLAKIILNEDLDSLLNFCLKIKKQTKCRELSNVGGFQSEDIRSSLPPIKSLWKNITLYSNIFSKDIFKCKENISINNLWININKYKDFNIVHDHPFSKISGVFYIKTPKNCGNIVFFNDSNIQNHIHANTITEYNNYNSSTWSMDAQENVLYLFPSWTKHYVRPNLSNEDRVSISFNLN